MNTTNLHELLFPYLSGELTEDQARLVEARVKEDPSFAQELALARAALRLTAYQRPIAQKPFFWTRLSVRLDEEEAPWRAWVWVAKRLVPSMVTATLIVATLLSYTQSDSFSEQGTNTNRMGAYSASDQKASTDADTSNVSILESALIGVADQSR